MRRTAIIAAAMALVSAPAFAASGDSTGCGLGSTLFDGQTGIAPQVLAVTTNGTFGNQTFGISSGPLGCVQDGTVRPAAKVAMFMGSNMDKLALDMSRGEGESLSTLAQMMGVKAADRERFYSVAQANVGTIFPSTTTTAGQALAALDQSLSLDPQLRRYVLV
jgi:hypothetical protein